MRISFRLLLDAIQSEARADRLEDEAEGRFDYWAVKDRQRAQEYRRRADDDRRAAAECVDEDDD